MANIRQPRHGSMQFWPRVRAKKETARVRSYAVSAKPALLAFAGYKAGMTQVSYTDNRKNSLTKGRTMVDAATIIECPPLNVIAVRLYVQTLDGLQCTRQITAAKLPADVKRRIGSPNKEVAPSFDGIDASSLACVRLLVSTQPSQTALSKKTADLFEVEVGGDVAAQLQFATTNLGKSISVTDVFAQGDLVDIHGVSKGKGFQGPVKRFGVSIRRHKSEKVKRGPASLGPWCGQGHVMYRVAHAGKMGYHLRTEYNKKILQIGADPKVVNPVGGIVRYGQVQTTYILIKGSVIGPKKRLVTFAVATRPNKKMLDVPVIEHVSTESQN